MFLYSFLAMTSYNIVKPLATAKFISDLGADNLPYVLLVAGVLIGVIMQLHSRAMGLLPRKWVIPVTQAGMVGLLLVFWALFQAGQAWASVGVYFFRLILLILGPCSSASSGSWRTTSTIRDRRSGCSGSLAAARALEA